MVVLKKQNNLLHDTRGSAIVEATILFPIMIMIFAGLVLLAIYLPTRATLQHATQYAATAVSAKIGDTWVDYDTDGMQYVWVPDKSELPNVYVTLVKSFGSSGSNEKQDAEAIVDKMGSGIIDTGDEIEMHYTVVNYLIYKEIVITATKELTMPVDLSFIGFPKTIPVTVSSVATVHNSEEFVRNMDIAAELSGWIAEKLGISDTLSGIMEKFHSFFNFIGA